MPGQVRRHRRLTGDVGIHPCWRRWTRGVAGVHWIVAVEWVVHGRSVGALKLRAVWIVARAVLWSGRVRMAEAN